MQRDPFLFPCPCCSNIRLAYSMGDRSVRMTDRIECLECGLVMETDYTPLSAVNRWNRRPAGATWKVFLDDERATPDGWVRTYWPDEVIALLQSENVAELSLDHDLGDDERGTGYTVLLWLEEQVVCHGFKPPKIAVHSANSSARLKMEAAIQSIERHAHPLRESEGRAYSDRRTDQGGIPEVTQ